MTRTKRFDGSMAKYEHIQNMNRPLTSVQDMFSIYPKRYGMNVPIFMYHCWKESAQNPFIFMAQSNIKSNICIFLCISRPGFDPYCPCLGGPIGSYLPVLGSCACVICLLFWHPQGLQCLLSAQEPCWPRCGNGARCHSRQHVHCSGHERRRGKARGVLASTLKGKVTSDSPNKHNQCSCYKPRQKILRQAAKKKS